VGGKNEQSAVVDLPQLAPHLDTTQPVIRRAITDHQLRQLPRRQRLARQRRPGGNEPPQQRPGALSSRRGRSSSAATHA